MTFSRLSSLSNATAIACLVVLVSAMIAAPTVSARPAAGTHITPQQLWVVDLDAGRTLEDVWRAGAEVLDHFPEAAIVSDRGSAAAAREAGFAVAGPFDVAVGREVTLLRAVDADASLVVPPAARVIWSAGMNAIVETDGLLPETAPLLRFRRQAMRGEPLRRPARLAMGGDAAGDAPSVVFPALVDEMVVQVDAPTYIDWIGNLAGANEVEVLGAPWIFTSRYTDSYQCDLAEEYVYEQFEAMGFTDVEFDPFGFSGVTGRNVIATLPGTETPNRIYILCGHLDSTSPDPYNNAPGANDNASGTASVLHAAEIMANYQFRSTIKFIAFTGEEQGLHGSRHYAQAAAAAGDSIMGVVNCDMVAFYDTRYQIDIEGEWEWDWLMQIMDDACAEYTALATDLTYFSWGSDHVPFQDEGFAAFLAIESDWASYPCYHQTCDLTEMNDAEFGAEVTRACLATIAYLAEPVPLTGVSAPVPTGPAHTRLLANRPNPFNPFTEIRFELPVAGDVTLAIHDAQGRLVRSLAAGRFDAGAHALTWDGVGNGGQPSASGVYFYTLQTGERTLTRKMILAR
jgi:hypothetical protein